MRNYAFLAFSIFLIGCQGRSEQPNKTAAHSKLPQFEIREFKIEREAGDNSWSYKGRGTLMTKDQDLQEGYLFVVIKEKKKPKVGDEKESVQSVLIANGIGTLENSAYYPKKTKYLTEGYDSDPGAPEYEWNILGFVRLQKAELAVVK
jgi:hypothetical protein